MSTFFGEKDWIGVAKISFEQHAKYTFLLAVLSAFDRLIDNLKIRRIPNQSSFKKGRVKNSWVRVIKVFRLDDTYFKLTYLLNLREETVSQ